MARRRHTIFLVVLILVIPAPFAVWWWSYWPIYHRKVLLASAEQAFAAANLAKAEEQLAQLVREDPDNVRAHFLYAQVLRRLGQSGDADWHLGRAGELGLPKAEGRREFGLLYAKKNFSLARGALEQELQAHPDDVEVLQALGEGFSQYGSWDLAELYFSRWLEVQPDRIEALLDRGLAYKESDRYDQALADFRAILQRSPDHFRARVLACHCLLAEARMAEAEPELLACRQMRPDSPEPLVGLAACAMERGDFDKAYTLLGQALELDPGSTVTLNELGNWYLQRARYDLALSVFEQVLRLDKKNKPAHLKLAQIMRNNGKLEQAREYERRFQELEKEEEKRLPQTGRRR
jgi:tetratricopeptide (TPR) repeat protein